MKPGNRLKLVFKHGANSCSFMLKDEKVLVCVANLFFSKRFFMFLRKEDQN